MKSQELKLIADVSRACISSGIDLIFEEKEMLYDPYADIYCEGWFDETTKLMVVASKQAPQDFIHTLSHEYCHLLQWKEGCKVFRTVNRSVDIMEDYLAGKLKRNKTVNRAINRVRAMELDCEKRNIDLLESYKLYSREEGIKRANAYIYFYSALKETAKWYKRSPSTIPEVLFTMPINFVNNYEISDDLLALYKKYCY